MTEIEFNILVRKIKPELMNYISTKCDLEEDYQDVLQETLIALWNKKEPCTDVMSYAKGTAKYIAFKYNKRKENLIETDQIDSCFDFTEAVHNQDLLDSLPTLYKNTLTLQIQGFSTEEIARRYAISPDAARKRLSRSKTFLKKMLI